jgi:hypothetical protein
MKIEMIMTNLEVQEFLKDFEISSETCILEEGKEKSELEKVAEARGMKIKGSRDLAVFKTIYAFADKSNSNGAILPKKELLRVLPQIIGKPVNINHNRRFVVGHYIDYKFKQKDSKVIAYGVFYKSNFGDEWTRAKELLKKKKLSSSFEIWSPDDKREVVGKGKYKLHFIEIAGGAFIYEDKNNVPAFKDAKVLKMARKEVPELVYASKYNEEEIITSDKDYFRDSVEENLRKLNEEKTKEKEESKPKEKTETPKIEEKKEPVKVEEKEKVKIEKKEPAEKPKVEKETKKEEIKVEPKPKEKEEPKVENNKIKCSNCGHEWERGSQKEYAMGSEQCLNCKAILKQDGTMIYPPQIIDFKVSCPSCRMGSWLLMEKSDKKAKVRCSCKKEYNLTFAEKKDTEMLDKINFPYSGSVSCSQCGKRNYYEGISGITSRNIKCKECGLEFPININKAKEYKKISKIEEIEVKKIEKTSEKGGNDKVELKSDKSKIETPKEKVKVEKPKEEIKAEEKKEEVKVDKPKEKEEPKVEKSKVEETPKIKEAPKTEEKVETAKVDTNPGLNMLADFVVVDGTYYPKKVAEEMNKAKEAKPEPIVKEEKQGNDLVYEMRDKIEPTKEELKKAEFEYIIEETEEEIKVEARELETSARLTTEQRNALPDNMFAVVVRVKNKRTGKMRKIRMFPINDKAHVRNALARLGQPAPKATLKRLGVSIEKVKAKILRRARQLKMTQLIKRYKAGINKLTSHVISLKKEVANVKDEMSQKIEFYKKNAVEINKRREELGDFGNDLTDEHILNNDKFEKARLEKENVDLKTSVETSSDVVGLKKKDDSYYAKKQKEINAVAFPNKEKDSKK